MNSNLEKQTYDANDSKQPNYRTGGGPISNIANEIGNARKHKTHC